MWSVPCLIHQPKYMSPTSLFMIPQLRWPFFPFLEFTNHIPIPATGSSCVNPTPSILPPASACSSSRTSPKRSLTNEDFPLQPKLNMVLVFPSYKFHSLPLFIYSCDYLSNGYKLHENRNKHYNMDKPHAKSHKLYISVYLECPD